MGRILSYIFVTIVSLLFITHSSGIDGDDTTLKSTFLHEFYYADSYPGHEEDSQIKYSSSDKSKIFTFCRLGRGPQSPHILKEKQYFSTGSLTRPISLASACVTYFHAFQSYNIHIPDRLKNLLYPKHSFW
jgi:hypothetical protein